MQMGKCAIMRTLNSLQLLLFNKKIGKWANGQMCNAANT